MMQTYLECSGSSEEAELLTSFSNQLSLSDSRQQVESDLQTLLNSLHDLSLVKSKVGINLKKGGYIYILLYIFMYSAMQ